MQTPSPRAQTPLLPHVTKTPPRSHLKQHEHVMYGHHRRENRAMLLTPAASGSTPRATLDLTMIGNQSVVAQEPPCPPAIWPMRRDVACKPLFTIIYHHVSVRLIKRLSDGDSPARWCIYPPHNPLQQRTQGQVELPLGRDLWRCPKTAQMQPRK